MRGVFSSLEEAEKNCQRLRESDDAHDVYIGPVGKWMPWHPNAYKTGRVEHLEEELNELMRIKNRNDESSRFQFEQRIQNAKKSAIDENISNAKTSGNKLTQQYDSESGDLVLPTGMPKLSDYNQSIFDASDVRLKHDKMSK